MSSKLLGTCMQKTCLVLLLLSAWGIQEVHAQADGAVETATDNSDEDEAKQIYNRALRHYDAGRYQDAASDFLQAYELSKHPALLFNVANAYERLADYENAIVYLEAYLETPNPLKRVSVIQRIQGLKARNLEQQEAKNKLVEIEQAKAAQTEIQQSKVQIVSSEPPNQIATKNRVLSYSLIAAGTALLAGGIVSGIVSSNASSSAEDMCSLSGFCPNSVSGDIDRAKNYGIIADLAVGSGIVVLGVGAFFYLTGTVKDENQESMTQFQIRPNTNGINIGVSRKF